MNEMKLEDVMRALECCVIQCAECTKCPMYYRKDNRGSCYTDLKRRALALIREKDEQIFKLENRIKECENGYEGTLYLERCKSADKDAEIERLQGALKAEERHNELTMECAKKALANARAEAITEFAERLKRFYSHLGGKTVGGSVEYHIEQIAKEMKGE